MGRVSGRMPVGYGPGGSSAPGKLRKRSASGHAAANARRMRLVVGRADIEAGDDEADVEAEPRRLNTGDGAPFAIPGLCLVARLGIAAQNSQVLDGASGADVVGDFVDFSCERLGTRQTGDVVDAGD